MTRAKDLQIGQWVVIARHSMGLITEAMPLVNKVINGRWAYLEFSGKTLVVGINKSFEIANY